MKQRSCLLLLCLAIIAGCSEKETIIDDTLTYPVSFSIRLNEEVLPFPNTRVMPSCDINEPVTRNGDGEGERKELKELCHKIEYIVYEKGSNVHLMKECFQSNLLNFGEITIELPEGEYDIAFLAYGDCTSTLDGTTISFHKPGDTFHTLCQVEVEHSPGLEMSVTLYRIVSKIEFVSTDEVPENIGSFNMEVDPYPSLLNVLTGRGIVPTENSSHTFTDLFEQGDIGQTGITHSFFTFVPEGDLPIHTTITAEDTEGTIMRSREVKDIMPIANRIIRYSGRLYTVQPSDDIFTLSIHDDGAWSGTDENQLEE